MAKQVISRGFRSRRAAEPRSDRVPPGQYATDDFPVLSAGPTPRTELARWTLVIQAGGSILAEWGWDSFQALPQFELQTDIHCVTKWSKLNTRWQGVTFDTLLEAAGVAAAPEAFVMAHCDGGYTTNLPVADLGGARAIVATQFDGRALAPEHGGPARLLVPHLYFWKSAKWVRRLRFMERNEPGFWEGFGYHIYGDPWREQRYSGD